MAGKVALGVLLLSVVLWQVDLAKLSQSLLKSDPWSLLLALGAMTLGVVVNAHRWALITRQIDQPIGLRVALVGYFESMFFNQILPTSVGGDAARVLRAIDAGVVYGWAIVGVLIDRASGLWILAVCLVAAYLVSASPIVASPSFLVLCIASAAILGGALLAVLAGAYIRTDYVPIWAAAVLTLAKGFSTTVLSRALPSLLLDLLLTTTCSTVSFLLCARAAGVSLGWVDALIVLEGISLASILPASIGGWGLREGAAILMFAPIGIEASKATAISVLFGLVITGVGLIGAAVWVAAGYRRRIRFSSRRSAVS